MESGETTAGDAGKKEPGKILDLPEHLDSQGFVLTHWHLAPDDEHPTGESELSVERVYLDEEGKPLAKKRRPAKVLEGRFPDHAPVPLYIKGE